MSMYEDYEFNEKIHAILLNPYLSKKDLDENIISIKKYNIKNISTSLNYLSYLKDSISNSTIKINTLISYPLGDLPINFAKELILLSKDAGADKVEYIPKFFLLENNQEESFANDIEILSNLDIPITLIFNKKKLNREIFIRAIKISLEIGVESFQIGDGFGKAVEVNEIKDIIKLLGNSSVIKIVGGIKRINDVKDILDSGADIVGTSFFSDIFQDLKNS